jgi:dihydroorotate dehydrogenase (NAD+) catalytic subunit
MTDTSTKNSALLKTKLAHLELDNPIMPASGCFGFGAEFDRLYDLDLLGAVALKATTLETRAGNQTARVAETEAGMLNAIGLQNPGLEKVLLEELALYQHKKTKVIMNVAGNGIEDYQQVVAKLCQHASVSGIELNVSCPNVKKGIMFGSDPKMLAELVKEVKPVTNNKLLIVKLSPNVTDIKVMAGAAIEAGAQALSLINTLIGMRIDLKTRKPIIANKTGGLSGPAIKPVAIRMIYEVYREFPQIPIIGMGGISNLDDMLEFFMAGASALAIGTANFVDPYICPQLITELTEYMLKNNIKSLNQLIGAAHS